MSKTPKGTKQELDAEHTDPRLKRPYRFSEGDGSNKTIKYRNSINSGEKKKEGGGPLLLTAEERQKKRDKYNEWQRLYRANLKRRKQVYRKEFYTVEEASQRAQLEMIDSWRTYQRWHKLNNPVKMPAAPHMTYAKEGWVSWPVFLGRESKRGAHKKLQRKPFRPYNEARAFVMGKGFKAVSEWKDFVRSGNCPEDIPHRPDIVYFDTGDWFSWREFLGPLCPAQVGQELEWINDKVLYILRINSQHTQKLYKIGVTVGGWSAIHDAMRKYNLSYVDAYIMDKPYEWKPVILKYGQEDWESDGVFEVPNINEFIGEVAQHFHKYKKPTGY